MGLENNFQASALKFLNDLPGCKAENVSGNANQSGRPDINGCYRGRMFKIELKSKDTGYQPSKKQQLELRKWKNAGCAVGVVYSLKFLKDLFSKPWPQYEMGWMNEDGSWFVAPYRKEEDYGEF